MPRESKKKTPKKKSTKESETPKMDEDEINRLMQNALDKANARAEQKFEERLTALREEFNQKHQEEMIELQDQLAQSRGGFTTQEKYAVKELMVDAVTAAHHSSTTVPYRSRYHGTGTSIFPPPPATLSWALSFSTCLSPTLTSRTGAVSLEVVGQL